MTAMVEPLGSIFAVAIGLIVGSFLNVCIYRLPAGRSVVTPASRCPSCGAPVRPWQNVPVVSWLILRARCASCHAPISWRYPAIEALSGAAVLALWRAFGPSAAFGIATGFAWMMIVLFFTDYDEQLLPDAVTLPGFALGIAVAWWNPFLGEPGWPRIVASAAGAALGSGILWGIGALYTRLRGVEGMGFGDVKMMALVGAFVGPAGVAFTLFAASVVGAVVGLALIPLKNRTLRHALPFGCFLAPAACAALLWGRPALAAYLGYLRLGP
ncbi:MAG TPA: prepilin peptidase [Candidatus Polarisedimenticolaceae bacterium]|nr:prepilin peptidase [Candidatus Polarisedimenticolaceae bacterium]